MVDEMVRVYSPAYFHHLRVEIKKMNAALRLVKYCSVEFPRKRILLPYRLLGKSAGEVREIQLEESAIRRLKQDQFTRKYLSALKTLRLEKKRKFLEVKNQVKKSLEKRHLKILPYAEEIDSIKTVEYFKRLRQNCISKMTGEKLKPSAIHEIRMLLKEFFYNIEILNPDSKTALKKINLLQDLIGKWHDYSVILKHLDNFKRRTRQSLRNITQLQIARSGFAARSSLLISRINKEKNDAISELHQLTLP